MIPESMPNNNPNKSPNTVKAYTDLSSDDGSEVTVRNAVMEIDNVDENDNNYNVEYMEKDGNYEDFLAGIEINITTWQSS